MKRTFQLTAPGKDDARVRDKVRHEVNKFLKRARQRELPEGVRRWDFTCRLGADEPSAVAMAWHELGDSIDREAEAGRDAVFIEIVPKPEMRTRANPVD